MLDLVALGLQPVEHALEADHQLRRADPLPHVREQPLHAGQQVVAFGQREHQPLVDGAVEAEAAVRVGLLDRAHILGPTQPHHERMGGEDHWGQLVHRAADEARIDLDRGLGVELGDEAPPGAAPVTTIFLSDETKCWLRKACTGRLVATSTRTAASGGSGRRTGRSCARKRAHPRPSRPAREDRESALPMSEATSSSASARAVDEKQREPIGMARLPPAGDQVRAQIGDRRAASSQLDLAPSTRSAAKASNSGRAKLTPLTEFS